MINNQLENQLSILEGSYSDELSFYIMDIAVGGRQYIVKLES
ncbi:MAG: hypothetical protein PHP79_05265 [Clostridia bacterium]|nr:hypothetical protein [Clostridia bacterium]